jgi:Caudovirus prohead serine protease
VLCSGKCGREGAGPIDSGGRWPPAEDARRSWCDSCWADLVVYRRMPPALAKELPPGTLLPFSPEPLSVLDYNSMAARTEHKIMAGTEVKSMTMAPTLMVTDSGSFTGYLAAYGTDLGGDTIQPGAMDETAAALNSGAIAWHLTDAHSDLASDVVATVSAAAVDSRGLRIVAQWMPTERAQNLRKMVRHGAKLGLSIDYLTDSASPDGKGGRLLNKITVVGGAVTPKPMNPGAFITEGKAAEYAPIVDVYDDAQARHADPDRDRIAREDAMLAAASWPPQGMFDRKTALALMRGAALAEAARQPEDDGDRLARERYDENNRYCNGLAAWMAAHR